MWVLVDVNRQVFDRAHLRFGWCQADSAALPKGVSLGRLYSYVVVWVCVRDVLETESGVRVISPGLRRNIFRRPEEAEKCRGDGRPEHDFILMIHIRRHQESVDGFEARRCDRYTFRPFFGTAFDGPDKHVESRVVCELLA